VSEIIENQTAREERLKGIVQRIEGLPTLPTILAQMNRMMLDPKTTAKDMAQLIASDPTVTARILKVVNSAFYGFPSRISTISHAIVILGFNTVKSIVLSSSVFDTFGGNGSQDGGFKREDFWRHSLACGAAAKVIGRHAGEAALEEFFIAGLLHDVGKVVLDHGLREDYAAIRTDVKARGILIREAEEARLGINHADVGGWLFSEWKLNRGLVKAVACHHNPVLADEHMKAASIVHLADIFARALQVGSGGDDQIPPIRQAAWDAVGLKVEHMTDLLRETELEIVKASVFLDFVRA